MLVEPSFDAVAAAARKKLKMSAKDARSVRLFVLKAPNNNTGASSATAVVKAGTEVPRAGGAALVGFLANDMVLSVSTGEDFIRPDGFRGGVAASAMDARVPRPPYFPWPLGPVVAPEAVASGSSRVGDGDSDNDADDNDANTDDADNDNVAQGQSSAVLIFPETAGPRDEAAAAGVPLYTMHGAYPDLSGAVLGAVRQAVKGCPAFVVKDRGAFVAVDYATSGRLSDVFPDPTAAGRKGGSKACWEAAVRRECRGLLLDRRSGVVVARRFHKFWNVGELAEASSAEVEARLARCKLEEEGGGEEGGSGGSSVLVTEKIDGSLASPFLLSTSADATTTASDGKETTATAMTKLHWALRTVECEALAAFVAAASAAEGGAGYEGLAREFLGRGLTPLFEW